MKTLYEILEVSKTASTDEIQKAYHKLAKRWHPDKNSKNIDEANKRFKEMGYANEILKDPVKREKYDYDLKNNNTVTYTEQRNPQTNQYYNHLDASIYSAMQFYYVLAHLNPEERSILFNKWKNTLQELVKNIDDFNLVLKYLNNKERLEFFELMKTRLPTMYQKIADSVNIYSYIKIEEVKESLPSLIPSLRDFYELMENCDEQERAHVFDAMKTLLPALAMKEYQPFIYIFTFLTDEQRATAFELLKPQLAKLIKDWSDLENTLDYINAKQFKILIDEVKANLVAKLDGNLNTFAHKIEYGKFSQGQIEAIVLVMKED
ncbi:MAG: J domain-containing protein, partial [Legionella sp.]